MRGLGLGLLERVPSLTSRVWKLVFRPLRSAGPLKLGACSWLVADMFDRVETLLLLRCRFLRIEPNNERDGFSGAAVRIH